MKPEPITTPSAPERALHDLEKFFEAPDLETKAQFVRDTARVLPLMRDYHLTRRHPFPSLGRVSAGRLAHFAEKKVAIFEVEPYSGSSYPVALIPDNSR
ncbi:MAG: hypothetical protein ACSHX7_01705 [Luteolibacter sp.]